MFKKNPDGMRMEPTPERVLSVCRLIANKSLARNEVHYAMTLGANGAAEIDQINKSISVALDEIGVIRAKDELLELAVSENVVQSPDTFRRYVSSIVFSQEDSTFVMFSKWVIGQNEKIVTHSNWEVLAKNCGREVSELSHLNENSALGWRFWASFLGLGYISGSVILPNMKLRIQDILSHSFKDTFNCNEAILAADFISWLKGKLPEADLTGRMPLAVSAGLRTLHELEFIKLETWRDSNRIMLFHIDGEPINDFSHITVAEEVCK